MNKKLTCDVCGTTGIDFKNTEIGILCSRCLSNWNYKKRHNLKIFFQALIVRFELRFIDFKLLFINLILKICKYKR